MSHLIPKRQSANSFAVSYYADFKLPCSFGEDGFKKAGFVDSIRSLTATCCIKFRAKFPIKWEHPKAMGGGSTFPDAAKSPAKATSI